MIFLAKCFRRLASILERWVQTKAVHERHAQSASAKHDMARNPDEAYYARQYLYWVNKVFMPTFSDQKAVVLDLGCGQGRLTVPISRFCSHIVGVDFTPQAIESAKQYARQEKRDNIDFFVADALEFIKKQPASTFDLVVLTEVTFFLPQYKQVLQEIHRALKPQGMAFIAFRSQFYNILHSVRAHKWESAQTAINTREGYLWGGGTWFSWHTQKDIDVLLQENGYHSTIYAGIGIFSGIEGDPFESIARPSVLDALAQEKLQGIETQLAQQYTDNGRYILAMTRK